MQPEEVIAQVKAKAKANFRAGLNCAESVFEAVLSQVDTGLPLETMCLMTGFGGGGGHFGDTCGALVGAMAALGAVYGRREIPTDPKTGQRADARRPGALPALQPPAQRIPAAFRQHPMPPLDRPLEQELALQRAPQVLPQPDHRRRRPGRGDGRAPGPGPLGFLTFWGAAPLTGANQSTRVKYTNRSVYYPQAYGCPPKEN